MRNWFQAFACKCNLYRYTEDVTLAQAVNALRRISESLPSFIKFL
jgi:hypothetical protein